MKSHIALGAALLLSASLLSGGTAFAKAKPSGDAAIVASHIQAQKNKALVLKAYQELLGDHDVTALDRYWAADYIQHNPHMTDGRAGVKADLERLGIFKLPKGKVEIVRAVAEGDMVWLQTHQKPPGSPDLVLIDIFRLSNGKIAEHWDVIQAVPDDATNPRRMY
ncbi:nuclear transport factor 2 family protein [Mesorhizobium carmichaelinearum]|uniref:nuclear transport factor 2 family protein n=1 Tax=Mesorhizobium carmichaelinearum TaxID=1208188 RepID=UPI000BA4AA0E|nr:nuclear transport factor 2 family protein [Mesorhizobium carmichaelinearum]